MDSSLHAVLRFLHSHVSCHHSGPSDDRRLLQRFTEARDGDAFAVLMRRHGPMVLSLARRVVGDAQLAEDVFQATFLTLARKAHTIRRGESLSCWLHGVAFRLALRVRRSQQRRQERESHVRFSHPPAPLDELTAQEFLAVLDEGLQQLPEQYRAPLILCCLEGLSQEEAAKRLGCSAGAVKGRLERGRQRLRLQLEKRGLTLPEVLGGALLLAGATSPVPAALVQATLQAATTGRGIVLAVAALIQEVMRSTLVNKFKAIGVAVLLLALSGTGVSMIAYRPQTAEENAAQPSADDKSLSAKKHADLYGDPLPEGAVLRLGTLRRRAVGAKLALTPDGNRIVTVRGLYVHVWDAATGKLLQKRQLPGDPADLSKDSWLSRDGRMLLSELSTGEGRLLLWDLQTGKQIRTLPMEGALYVSPAAFSADGKRIAAAGCTGGQRHCIRVWERDTGKVIFTKEIRNSTAILFTPDGKRLLTGISDETHRLICWDLAKGHQLWDVANISPYAMVCTTDGKLLSSDKVLDLATGHTVSGEKMPPTDGEFALHLALSPDERTLFFSTHKEVIVWDRTQGKVVRRLPAGGLEVAVWPDGKSLLTNAAGLQRWDLDSGNPLYADSLAWGHTDLVCDVAWSADGRRLASYAVDGTLRVWDAVTGRLLRLQHDRKRMRFFRNNIAVETGDELVALSPDGRWLLSKALGEECLKVWAADTGKEIRSLGIPAQEIGGEVLRARITSDGARIVALLGDAGPDSTLGWNMVRTEPLPTVKVVVWDVKTGRVLTCQPIGEQSVESVGIAIAPDGRTVVYGGVLMNTATGKEVAQLEQKGRLEREGRKRLEPPIAFSCDGALVAGAFPSIIQKGDNLFETWPNRVRIWETASGKMIAHVNTKVRPAELAFHPDNRFLATSGGDGIQIWDVRTGKLAVRQEMPEKPNPHRDVSFARCFAFSADGRLATGHPDSTILVWDVPLPAAKPQHLEAKELQTLWADLADADAAKAWGAIWRLADAPKEAMAFLRGRVKPHPTPAAEVTRKLLADLDSDSFAVREAAVKRLKELGPQAEPALRATLKAKPSLERRRRIEELLAAAPPPPSSEELRQLRALIVLERIGTPEARRLLVELAKGPESARQTRQALMALASLRKSSR